MCRISRRAASFRRVPDPWVDAAGFAAAVAERAAAVGAKVILPGHEDAIILARERDRLPPGVVLPVADAALLERAADKGTALADAAAAGVPVPRTFRPEDDAALRAAADAVPYPAVVKPRIGNSAKGVSFVNDAAACVAAVKALVATHALPPHRWPLVQERVAGEGYGVCLLLDRGEPRAFFVERYLRCKDGDTGTSTFRESVHRPDLVAHATTLARKWGWHGVMHLDFLCDDVAGRVALIEVNPRFWGALDLSVRAGVDFPWLLYRLAVDGSVADGPAYKDGVRSRWIVGEGLHLVNHARRFRVGAGFRALGSMLGTRATGHDDFDWTDPLPLLLEGADYGWRFLRAGSANPVGEGMIR
jgi:predicted ATP-grasp superfamily ATP-dependent carboligase